MIEHDRLHCGYLLRRAAHKIQLLLWKLLQHWLLYDIIKEKSLITVGALDDVMHALLVDDVRGIGRWHFVARRVLVDNLKELCHIQPIVGIYARAG